MTALILLAAVSAAPPAEASFSGQVAPLLRTHCLGCHAGPSPKGDLDLTSRKGMLAGGGSGQPALTPGEPLTSPLFSHVRDGKMPPRKPLPDTAVDLLRRWIAAGAKWQGGDLRPVAVASGRAGLDWWSLQPVKRPALPAVKQPELLSNPIDAFVLAKLEASGLSFAPQADRRTLLRRVAFDLTGLPPTPEEIDAFVEDRSPEAYEKVVDRLLSSPAYGERWARHWLDVVRFAESHGYEMNTLRPNAWPYRDYVIRAFNRGTPYARFVREQLAGDALADADFLTASATGFLVAGPHDLVGNATLEGRLQQRADDMADLVANTSTTFLGLTVGCARCHDHKFDPISQKDFYSLQAIFSGVEHNERTIAVTDPARQREADQIRLRIAELHKRGEDDEPLADPSAKPHRRGVEPRRNVERFAAVEARFVRFTVSATTDGTEPCIDELELYGPDDKGNLALASAGAKPAASSVYPNSALHKLEHLNDGRHGNGRSWISAERGKGWVTIELRRQMRLDRVVWGRDRDGRYQDRLARTYQVETSTDGKTWKVVASSADRLAPGRGSDSEADRLRSRLASLESMATVYAGTFRKPDVVHQLKRGEVLQKLGVIGPGAISSLKPALKVDDQSGDAQRRLALADWIVRDDNPLTWRVLVNRLWHWHFGQGLVRTPSDFGYNGDRPSHPELLDWLAAEAVTTGGSLRPLHRLIVLSTTYRQSSRYDAKAAAIDAGNRLLWRRPIRRLEAEPIRDAMLATSGAMERQMGGPGYHLWKYSGYVIAFEPKAQLGPAEFRRMVYQFKPRLQQDGTFGAFDCPDATATTPRRNVSNTALQALNLLNDPFVLDQAERFAQRVRREAGSDAAEQVTRAFRLAFGRAPSRREAAAATDLVNKHGLTILCRAMFNAAEFVFVD